MAQATADVPRGMRIVGLDAWRVLLMLGGFLLHGSLWQPSQPLFTGIALLSHSFRMGSFFAISGFLCGVSMRKYSSGRWLARRTVQIGLPTLFGWGILCPVTWLMSHRWHPSASTPLLFDWLHIWFLVALLAYAPVAVWLAGPDARAGWVDRLADGVSARGSALPLLLGVAATSFVLMLGTAALVPVLVSPRLGSMLSQMPMMTGYLPNYLLGLAMARSAALARTMQQSWRPALAIVTATGASYALWFAVAPMLTASQQEEGAVLMMTVAAALCPPAAFALIFRSAIGVQRLPHPIYLICDASLTMYLFHLPLLLVAHVVLAPLALHPYGEYALAIALAAPLSYGVHAWIIRPTPWLALIVNGRIDRWQRTLPAQPVLEPR